MSSDDFRSADPSGQRQSNRARSATMLQKIVPNLWFDGGVLEAAEFYVSVFGKDSRIVSVSHYSDAVPDKAGEVLAVEWELQGQRFVGINGGPQFTFDEAVSFSIDCADQAEIDYYWERLI